MYEFGEKCNETTLKRHLAYVYLWFLVQCDIGWVGSETKICNEFEKGYKIRGEYGLKLFCLLELQELMPEVTWDYCF